MKLWITVGSLFGYVGVVGASVVERVDGVTVGVVGYVVYGSSVVVVVCGSGRQSL